jgi:hypothetical protein
MKTLYELINEQKGGSIDDQWLQDEKPVMTKNGKNVLITKIDISVVPNVIIGQVKVGETSQEFNWQDDGTCIKAADKYGNPKQPDDNDRLVKAI